MYAGPSSPAALVAESLAGDLTSGRLPPTLSPITPEFAPMRGETRVGERVGRLRGTDSRGGGLRTLSQLRE